LLEATMKYQVDVDQWDSAVDLILVGMPASHCRTLQHLLSMLAKIAANVGETSMDSANLGKIFAPTLFRSPNATSDDANAGALFQEIALAGKMLSRQIARKIEEENEKKESGDGACAAGADLSALEDELAERFSVGAGNRITMAAGRGKRH
jgi:hypothetical protein